MGAVRVNLTVGGVASAGATVTAKHDTTSGTCPTGSPSLTGFALGTTNSAGTLETAVPWGHWVLTITPTSGAATTRTVSVSAGSSSAVVTAVAL